jgi:hypothetical protein
MATLLQEAAQLVTEDPSLGELIDNALDVSDNATVVSIADVPINTAPQTEVLVDVLDGGTSIVGFNNISTSVPVTATPLVQPVVTDAVVSASTEVTEPAVTNISIPQIAIALPAGPIAAPPVMGILPGDEVFVDPLLDTVPEDGFVDPLLDIAPLDPSVVLGEEEFVDPLLDTVPVDGFVDPLLDIVPIEEAIESPNGGARLARPPLPGEVTLLIDVPPAEGGVDPLLDTVPEDGFVDPLLDVIQVDEAIDPSLDTLPVETAGTSGARLAGPALGLATLMIDVPPAEEGVDPLLDTVPVEDFVDPLLDIVPVGEAIETEEVVFTKPLTLDGLDAAVPTDTTVMNGDGVVLPEGTFDPCTCWAAPLTDPVGSGAAVDPSAPPVLLVDYAAPTGFIVDYAAPPVL